MTVLITLTTAGTDTGPFDLYSNADGYVSAFETGVSKAALQAGYSSSLVPNTATIIRVKSTGVCSNYIDIPLTGTTTTTTSSSSTTTTSTTSAPPPPTTTTTTSNAPFQNLFFDATTGVGGYTVTVITVNGLTPTLTSGTDVPFSTDGHGYSTNQIGTSETLTIGIGSFALNGCITVIDSASNSFQQNVTGSGNYIFPGLTIDNITPVTVILADNVC